MKGLSLGQFIEKLQAYVKSYEGQDISGLRVRVPLSNQSMGSVWSANVTDAGGGIDWDADSFFLHTDKRLFEAFAVDKKLCDNFMRDTWNDLFSTGSVPRNKKDVFFLGYREGFNQGVYSQFPAESEALELARDEIKKLRKKVAKYEEQEQARIEHEAGASL